MTTPFAESSPLTPLIVSCLFGGGFLLCEAQRKRWKALRLLRSGIGAVDGMSGSEFEAFLAALFEKAGYAVRRIGRSGDFGGDLVLMEDRVRIVVQAKRYQGWVGVRAVQEAVAAKGYYRCDRAWVVTNSRFTRQAVELARANGVDLWDRDRLASLLLQVRAKSVAAAE